MFIFINYIKTDLFNQVKNSLQNMFTLLSHTPTKKNQIDIKQIKKMIHKTNIDRYTK